MNRVLNRRQSLEGYCSNLKFRHNRDDADERKLNSFKQNMEFLNEINTKLGKDSSGSKLKKHPPYESYRIIQALLLIISISAMSYYSIRYGYAQYSFLENGKVIQDYPFPHKTVVTMNIGYPPEYAVVLLVGVTLMMYSIISKKSHWSLPLLCVHAYNLMNDITFFGRVSYRLFGKMAIENALFYTGTLCLIITAELWIFFGVLQLFKSRNFTLSRFS